MAESESKPLLSDRPTKDNGLADFFKSATAVMFLGLLAKGLGYFEKVSLGYFEGASASMDAYETAIRLAFFLFVLVDDILAPVFVSMYVTMRKQQGDAEAYAFYRQILWITVAVLLVAVLVMELFAGSLMTFIAPGFDAVQRTRTVGLLRWTLPGGLFLGVAGLTYVLLNAHRQFAWPEFTKTAYKATIILCIILLLPVMGIVAAAIGMCIAAMVQLGLHLLGIRKWARPLSIAPLAAGRTTSQMKILLRLMIPLAIGTIAAQISGFVDNNRGSILPTGSLAALGYARKLVDLPILLVPGVLGIVALPRFAELIAKQQLQQMTSILARLTVFCLVVFIPACLVFILTPEPIVEVVFARGQFDQTAVAFTSRALLFFSIGLLAYAVEILILRAYYAMLDTKTPIVVGLVYVAVNIAMTIGLTPVLGMIAIPLALSVQKTFKVITLFIIMAHRFPGPWIGQLGRSAWRIILCGIVFWAVFSLTGHVVVTAGGHERVGAFVSLIGTVIPASIIYLGGLLAVGLVDLRTLLTFSKSAVSKVANTLGR